MEGLAPLACLFPQCHTQGSTIAAAHHILPLSDMAS